MPALRTDFLREEQIAHDGRNRFAEDFMLYVRCPTNGARWWLSPEALYRYAISPDSFAEQQSSNDPTRIRHLECEPPVKPEVPDDPVLVRALTASVRAHKLRHAVSDELATVL